MVHARLRGAMSSEDLSSLASPRDHGRSPSTSPTRARPSASSANLHVSSVSTPCGNEFHVDIALVSSTLLIASTLTSSKLLFSLGWPATAGTSRISCHCILGHI